MNVLKNKIHNLIKKSGPISLALFMEISMKDKMDGYYRKKMPLGSKGDFVTAPDISQIFGEIIGIWILDIWIKLGRPNDLQIVDLGGGRGTLLKDIDRVLNNKIKDLIFIDINKELIEIQKKSVKNARHFEKITDIPRKPTIFIGNEFLDTFPIHQFIKKNNSWREVCINSNNNDLFFSNEKTELSKEIETQNLLNLDNDSIIEINFKIREIVKHISDFIKKNSGTALFFDYGYLNGYGNSLQGIRKNKFINPLAEPGLVDLTSHVDFGDIEIQSKYNSVDIHGPITQGAFLENMGALERLSILERNANDNQKNELRSGLKRLMSKDEMGDLFKVFALSPKNFPSLEGFSCAKSTIRK